jgi:hypothetical protein
MPGVMFKLFDAAGRRRCDALLLLLQIQNNSFY